MSTKRALLHSEQESEENGGYLGSVSDLMAGLTFIFIITLLFYVINFNQQKMKTQTQEEKARQEKQQLMHIKDELTDAKEARAQLLTDIQKSLQEQGVRVHIDTERGLLQVPESVLFRSGRAEFLPGGKKCLQVLARQLANYLPCYCGRRGDARPTGCSQGKFKPGRLEAVFVEGHTDNVPIRSGRFQDNWDLSAKRSIVTYQLMLKNHPELEGLLNQDGEALFGVSGYAATRPVVRHEESTPEVLNRRIDLRFILAPPRPQDMISATK